MEWIKIGENKIKVMLSAEEAARYALSPACKEGKDTLARQAFRAILSDVRDAADFDASEDKVYVQLYPSRAGGFELFITKMGVELADGTDAAPTYKKSTVREISLSFGDLPSLIAVCRRLLEQGFTGESAAYLDDAHRYRLLLRDKGAPTRLRDDYRFAREYGEIESADTVKILLAEHGKCICGANAVEQIGIL